MLKLILRSTYATLILAVILCGAYPLAVTLVGSVLFHQKAQGDLTLIGQSFSKPEYFHGRPSAAGTNGYDASNSSGSNLGPTNQKFADTLKSTIDSVLKENPTLKKGEVPVDLVTASGSGLDPHLSPEAALVQVDRVAETRGISVSDLHHYVDAHVETPPFGLFGESVVNVLVLNRDLDEHFPKKQKSEGEKKI